MIYVDSSVALASLLAEDRTPPASLWQETLIASRLLEYEVWNRINGRRLAASHGDAVRALLAGLALVELVPAVLARALNPFPAPVRTPDALHLATAQFVYQRERSVRVASYDQRLLAAAVALGLPTFDLDGSASA